MGTAKRAAAAAVLWAGLAFPEAAGPAFHSGIPAWRAVEIALPEEGRDEASLGRPLALSLGPDILYVADAQDCAIKAFSKSGRYLGAFGRKGGGPGELSFPSGVSVSGGKILVADKFNRRIQTFDGGGRPRGSFAVPFPPDKIFDLGGGALLVTGNPAGRRAGERLLHIYDEAGRLQWEGLEAKISPDPVFDAFRNMIQVCPGKEGDFCVLFRSGDRTIRRYARTGVLLRTIPVDERLAFRPLDMPFRGPRKRVLGFCWAAARDGGLIYISAPEPVDGRDLGPGSRLSVIDEEGLLLAAVALPCPVHRFVVEGRRIFAIDDEGRLRLFEVVR